MLSVDFFVKNPKSHKLESLRIRLIGNISGKKPRKTNTDKNKLVEKSKVWYGYILPLDIILSMPKLIIYANNGFYPK